MGSNLISGSMQWQTERDRAVEGRRWRDSSQRLVRSTRDPDAAHTMLLSAAKEAGAAGEVGAVEARYTDLDPVTPSPSPTGTGETATGETATGETATGPTAPAPVTAPTGCGCVVS